MEDKKPQILLVGYRDADLAAMKVLGLKPLTEKYQFIAQHTLPDAIQTIAEAALRDNNPIQGVIFTNSILTSERSGCSITGEIARRYGSEILIALLSGNKDTQTRVKVMFTSTFAVQGSWVTIGELLDKKFT